REERGGGRLLGRAEAEDRRRPLERLRQVGQRGDADAAADEQRSPHVEPEAVPERAEDRELGARRQRRERTRAGADGLDQEGELAARREAEREGAREHAPERLDRDDRPALTTRHARAPRPRRAAPAARPPAPRAHARSRRRRRARRRGW